MKRIIVLSVCLALALALCACGNNTPQENAAATSEEAVSEQTSRATTEPTAEATPEPTSEATPQPEVVHPYAWLGYEALPDCRYMDCISSDVFYREYDSYMSGFSGYVLPCFEASDGRNTSSSTDGSNVNLNLDGMLYVFNDNSMIYMVQDMTDVYPATLEARREQMEIGTNATGRVFQSTGSEAVPLYSEDNGDTASYDYYEFLIDGSTDGMTVTTLERVYFKDGDVFAIWTQVTMDETIIETTQVITAISEQPDPALFALPANFDEYELYE